MDKLLLSYLAGALDADGFITISRNTIGQRSGGTTAIYFRETIGLKQVVETVPRMLKDRFGGTLYLEKPSARKGKPLWSWTTSSKVAARCLTDLLPYLKVKRRQAVIALALRARIDAKNFKYGGQGRKEIPLEEWQERERLCFEIKQLNDNRTWQPRLIGIQAESERGSQLIGAKTIRRSRSRRNDQSDR